MQTSLFSNPDKLSKEEQLDFILNRLSDSREYKYLDKDTLVRILKDMNEM